jgi:hypothetical protein
MQGRVLGVGLGLCLALTVSMAATAQVFVVPGGAGAMDGTSWADAYGDVATALADPNAATEDVWVAGGTYVISTIEWPTDVAAYGGFAGTETELAQRDIAANETTLDANGSGRAIWSELTANIRIDGFSITGSNDTSGGGPLDFFAGGALTFNGLGDTNVVANCRIHDNGPDANNGNVFLQTSAVRFENCVFENNTAAAGSQITAGVLVNDGSNPVFENCVFRGHSGSDSGPVTLRGDNSGEGSSATLINCLFENNTGFNKGGGVVSIVQDPSTLVIDRCTFRNNSVAGFGAGSAIALESFGGTADITNTVFINNTASGALGDGVVMGYGANPSTTTIAYCTFYGNSGERTLRQDGKSENTMTLNDSIIWGNTATVEETNINAVNNSIIEGGFQGGIDQDPLFVDAANGDLTLQQTSPALSIGTAPVPATDNAGNPRPLGGGPDLGAFELAFTVPDVTGLTQSDAENAILAANLTLGQVTTASSDTVPAGEVISTSPQGGAALGEGGPVDLVISSGPSAVVMPVAGILGLGLTALAAAAAGIAAIRRKETVR